jgi:hypothetical protein
VKRSRSIRLVLIGGVSAGLAGCGPSGSQARSEPLSASEVYTNNHYVPGVGYYHAPFRAWYGFPYNHFDAKLNRYYHGGQWSEVPHESITNISSPTPVVASQAQTTRTDVTRSGFGSTSRHFSTYS